METEIVVNIELIKQKYTEFKQKEHTEIEKAESVARKAAADLGWNEVATNQLIDYIVGVAKAQLASEKGFWDEIVTEKEVEEEVEEPIEEVSEQPIPNLL